MNTSQKVWKKKKNKSKKKRRRKKYFPENKTVKDNDTCETYKSGKRKNIKTNER